MELLDKLLPQVTELKEAWGKRPTRARDAIELWGGRVAPWLALLATILLMARFLNADLEAGKACIEALPSFEGLKACRLGGGVPEIICHNVSGAFSVDWVKYAGGGLNGSGGTG